jgi:hypothetical protein
MTIQLPKQIIPATKKNPRITLFYGAPKCGKTSEMAKLENNLIIDIENGSNYVDALKIQAKNWKEVYQIGEQIKAEGRPYKYVTLDTATQLELWAEDLGKSLYLNAPMAAAKYKNNPDLLQSILVLPGEKGAYGPGYQWLRIAYFKCFNYLLELAEHLILIAHVRDNQLVDKDGTNVASSDLALTGKLKQITCSKADAIGYMYRVTTGAQEGKPLSELRVSFMSGLDLLSGTRCAHLAGQDMLFDWSKIFIEEGDSNAAI